MKKIVVLLMLCGLCLTLQAKDQKHKLEIAYEGSDYAYREPHTTQKLRLAGRKRGLHLVYTNQSVLSRDVSDEDPSFASLEFRYMDGKTDWKDANQEADTNVRDHYMEAALKFGRKYQLANPLQLRPYLGIGWREAQHGEDPFDRDYLTVDYGISYEEAVYVTKTKTTYFYIPIGSNLMLNIGEDLTVTLNGEFDWLIHGRINAHAPGYFVNSNNISVSAPKGYGVRVSVKAELDMGPMGVFIEPFWRYWQVQRSSKYWYDLDGGSDGGCTRAPMNTTREYGIRAGISF